MGRYGGDFYVYKFRSMRVGADKKGLITVGGRDPRITRTGYLIRKYKLDELPQLFNVLKVIPGLQQSADLCEEPALMNFPSFLIF